jgi:hypothetical protein
MKNYIKPLFIFIIFVILSSASSFDNSNGTITPGTVTITLTGATSYDGKDFYFLIFSPSDLVNSQGFSSFTITSGGGSGIIQNSGSNLTLSDGSYYLTCFIDEDQNTTTSNPTVGTGDDYYISSIVVNGDTTVNLIYPGNFTVQ